MKVLLNTQKEGDVRISDKAFDILPSCFLANNNSQEAGMLSFSVGYVSVRFCSAKGDDCIMLVKTESVPMLSGFKNELILVPSAHLDV